MDVSKYPVRNRTLYKYTVVRFLEKREKIIQGWSKNCDHNALDKKISNYQLKLAKFYNRMNIGNNKKLNNNTWILCNEQRS